MHRNHRNTRTSTQTAFTLKQFVDTFHNNEPTQREQFFNSKWPNGFICKECGHTHCHYLENRHLYQCNHCCHQESLFACTAFQGCKLGTYTILLAIYLFVSSQSGISGTQLAYDLGINVNSARLFLRKLRTIVDFENNKQMLEGFVDIDEAYMGGVDRGNERGKGSKKKTILVAQELSNKVYPGMAKLAPCTSENGKEFLAFVQKYIKKRSMIHSDKGKGFLVLKDIYKDMDGNPVLGKLGKVIQKYPYTIIQEKSDKTNNPMKWIHTLISNLKSELLGIYHGILIAYIELYLAEFEWKYNKRFIRSNLHKMHELMKASILMDIVTQKDIQKRFRTVS